MAIKLEKFCRVILFLETKKQFTKLNRINYFMKLHSFHLIKCTIPYYKIIIYHIEIRKVSLVRKFISQYLQYKKKIYNDFMFNLFVM